MRLARSRRTILHLLVTAAAIGVGCAGKKPPAASESADAAGPPPLRTVDQNGDQPMDAAGARLDAPPSGGGSAVPEEEAPQFRTHVVRPGDTYYSISARYYGDGRQWRRVYAANRNRAPNPNDLPIGIKLIIP